MEVSSPFPVILPSNISGEHQRTHNYTTKLATRIAFNSPNWEVAATEISYPKSWYNLREESEVIFVNESNEQSGDKVVRIKAGYYESAFKLVGAINTKIKQKFKGVSEANLPTLKYYAESNKVTPSKGNINNVEVYASFKDNLRDMLGLRDPKPPTNLKKLYEGYSSDIIDATTKISLTADSQISFVDLNNAEYNTQKIKVKVGEYKDIDHFLNWINAEVRKEIPINPPTLSYQVVSSREPNKGIVRHYPGEERGQLFYLSFGEEVRKALGIRNQKDEINLTKFYETLTPYTVSVKAGFSALHFYTNIVQHTLIGTTSAPILRVVKIPEDIPPSGQVTIEYFQPHYKPLAMQEIESIEIDVRDDTGAPVLFEEGVVTVTLEFRERNV